MKIDETLKNNLIADVENICDITLDVGFKTSLKRAFEITVGHHYSQQPIEPINREKVIELINKLPVIKKTENTWENKKYIPVVLELIDKNRLLKSIASELCPDAGEREQKAKSEPKLPDVRESMTGDKNNYCGNYDAHIETPRQEPVNNDKAIIEKQDEVIKHLKEVRKILSKVIYKYYPQVTASEDQKVKLVEIDSNIDKLEQELQALKGE